MYRLWQIQFGEKVVKRESNNLALLLLRMALGEAQHSTASWYRYGKTYGVDRENGELVTMEWLESQGEQNG